MTVFTHVFQAIFLAHGGEHGTMNLKLAELGVAVEEVDQINLRERLERVQVAAELNLHHQVLHLARALQDRAHSGPVPLNAAQGEVIQIWEPPSVHLVDPPCNISSQNCSSNPSKSS